MPRPDEILARGPQVMQGYHELPRQTAATLTPDGWLRTGDLGAWDAAGNLRITGIRKDLLVLASGKKVSPRPLEAELEGSDLIARATVVDLGNNGLGVLVWPDGDSIRSRSALDGATVQELLVGELRRLLGGHASYERPRRLGHPAAGPERGGGGADGQWTPESGRHRHELGVSGHHTGELAHARDRTGQRATLAARGG